MKEKRKVGMRTKHKSGNTVNKCAQEAMEERVGGPESAPPGRLLGITKRT